MWEGVGSVVIVEDDPAQRAIFSRWLELAGYEVTAFEDGESCLRGLLETLPDVVCLDLQLPGISGLETLERIRARHPGVSVIMLTAEGSVEPVVQAIRLGAYEYLTKPADPTKLRTTVKNAIEQARMTVRLLQLQHEVAGWDHPDIVGRSPVMRALFRDIDRVSLTDVRVLIRGESGTGKELIARAVHDSSSRAEGPLVSVNCAAISESLQESELFGHEKGAFTGAVRRRRGHFEMANGGTLFLDEVGELTPALQAKVLRVIEEQRFHRLGGDEEIHSDFRLIAATHRDLGDDVATGRFRQDLYFRLAVFELSVPPLRERGGDIRLLAETFAERAGWEFLNRTARITPEAMAALSRYAWPGNVRELQNVVQRAVVASATGDVDLADLPDHIRGTALTPTRPAPAGEKPASAVVEPRPADAHAWARAVPDLPLADLERDVILTLMDRHGGNVSAVARLLEISRTTLYRKLDSYDVDRTVDRELTHGS